MAASTLYRFRIEVSDVDRAVYESLDFRVAMHPSEAPPFLLTRVLAYALNYGDGLEFSPGGLSDTDEPALKAVRPDGTISLWIEVGNPSARKLARATRAADRVRVYTYKDPEILLREVPAREIGRPERVEIFAFPPPFLRGLEPKLARDLAFGLVVSEGSLVVSVGEESFETELLPRRLSEQAR